MIETNSCRPYVELCLLACCAFYVRSYIAGPAFKCKLAAPVRELCVGIKVTDYRR